MFEILYHIFVCPLFCIVFHYVFHRKYDKKHMHIDYDEVASRVKSMIDNQEEQKIHFCTDKCAKGDRK